MTEQELVSLRQTADALQTELLQARARISAAESELRIERNQRIALQESLADMNAAAALERVVRQHGRELETANARLEAATIRHERAIASLVDHHRREISDRLDAVLEQNQAIFREVSSHIAGQWSKHGSSTPSPDKEHWYLLARDEEEAEDGGQVITFKIRSGQKKYIDRLSRDQNVLLSRPAGNGINIRQIAKQRMQELFRGQEGFQIKALSFSCTETRVVDLLLEAIIDSIEEATALPRSIDIENLWAQASSNIFDAFNPSQLFHFRNN